MLRTDHTIFIIGAGAIGKVLSVFLKQQGKDVVLVRGHIDDEITYQENIVVELKHDEIIERNIQVSTISNCKSLDGLVVIATKSYGNEQIAKKLKEVNCTSPIVILQNGLDVEAPFIEKGFTNIYRCVLFATSQYIGNKMLRFKPAAICPVGVIVGNNETLGSIIDSLNTPYFKFEPVENIQPLIWIKAIINSVFNSVCPLLETDNGIFYRNDKALRIARDVIDECIQVAAAVGIMLHADTILNRLLLISKASDGQLISTYQDILNKRNTEIETMNMSIARVAESVGRSSLIKQTKLLGELIQIKSEKA